MVQRDYLGLYCTGCEDFYLDRDLEDGKCPDHGTPPIEVAEKNYFFRLGQYESWLAEILDRRVLEVVPSSRRNEVLSFVRRGLTEFSISRQPADQGLGTPVPGDDLQTVYVWVDALINYVSALGFGSNQQWRDWWNEDVEKVHVIGKNVWKFHAIYWPALLKSAGLPLPDKIVVHGFITADGRKIGKSLGNAVDPFGVIGRYAPMRFGTIFSGRSRPSVTATFRWPAWMSCTAPIWPTASATWSAAWRRLATRSVTTTSARRPAHRHRRGSRRPLKPLNMTRR